MRLLHLRSIARGIFNVWSTIGAFAIVAFTIVLAVPLAANAQDDGRPAELRGVGLTQRLDQPVPLDLVFRDEAGRARPLSTYFGATPVVLFFTYYDCPMLCPLVLNDVLRAVRAIPLSLGSDYRILTVSISPRDTPEQSAERHRSFTDRYGRSGSADAWHFLTGEKGAIDSLARSVGFSYDFDPKSGQYAHAAAIMVLTPDGRLSRYFYGLEYSPRDLRLALVEASQGRIGSLADQLLLFCFHYDPSKARYAFVVLNAVRAGGVATVIGLSALMAVLFKRERYASSRDVRRRGRTHVL